MLIYIGLRIRFCVYEWAYDVYFTIYIYIYIHIHMSIYLLPLNMNVYNSFILNNKIYMYIHINSIQ